MARWKAATLLALLISCALPLAGTGQTSAAPSPEVSKPSTAPEYFQMVQALADRDNLRLKKLFVTDSSGKIVEAPDKTAGPLPFHFRAPTVAEVEKMGPIWPTVPPDKNAAYFFGKAVLLEADNKETPAGSASSPLYPYAGDIEALAKWVESKRPVLETMREGLKQDVYCMPPVIEDVKGAPVPPSYFLTHVRQIARDLTDAGFVEEVKGRPHRAASCYLEAIRFGRKFHDATVVECLTGVAVQFIGQKSLDSLVANAKLSDETLRGVIVACREAEVAQDVPARIEASEAALAEATAALVKMPYRDEPEMIRYYRSAKAMKEFAAGKPLDRLLQVHWMQAAYEKELKELADKETEEILPRTFGELGRINARLRMTELRAALALYQKANGRLPDSLDALCPVFLPSVPIDPFSGKPMRYAKTPDGWKMWSFGLGNVDNGGAEIVRNEFGQQAFNDNLCTERVQSNIERRSKGAIKSLPAPAEAPKEPAGVGR